MKNKEQLIYLINELQKEWSFVDEGLTEILVENLLPVINETFKEGFDEGFNEGQNLPF